MSNVVDKLRIVVEKLALHKGKRGLVCRVFAPSAGARAYSIVLEYNRNREQIYLDSSTVAQFDRTGNDQLILNSIRTAIHNLERLEKKADSRKPRT
jgi:hypothetical protein